MLCLEGEALFEKEWGYGIVEISVALLEEGVTEVGLEV